MWEWRTTLEKWSYSFIKLSICWYILVLWCMRIPYDIFYSLPLPLSPVFIKYFEAIFKLLRALFRFFKGSIIFSICPFYLKIEIIFLEKGSYSVLSTRLKAFSSPFLEKPLIFVFELLLKFWLFLSLLIYVLKYFLIWPANLTIAA